MNLLCLSVAETNAQTHLESTLELACTSSSTAREINLNQNLT